MTPLGKNSRNTFISIKMVALLVSACLVFTALIGGFVTGNMQPLQWMLPYLLGVISGRFVSISQDTEYQVTGELLVSSRRVILQAGKRYGKAAKYKLWASWFNTSRFVAVNLLPGGCQPVAAHWGNARQQVPTGGLYDFHTALGYW